MELLWELGSESNDINADLKGNEMKVTEVGILIFYCNQKIQLMFSQVMKDNYNGSKNRIRFIKIQFLMGLY